jgi:RimJ/RimL family protein N-acetyltransferase
MSTQHRSRLAGFIIDCRTEDLSAASRFWSEALRMPFTDRDGNGYDRLDARDRDLQVEVQRVTHESRVHLDIETDDVEAEVARLEGLGATRVEKVKTWWVMQAPTGQRFCVVRGEATARGTAPVIETERLRLRPHRLDDFDDLAAMWADPVTTRHIGGRPSTAEESWARLLRHPGHWRLFGYGYWAIEERASGRYAGDLGLADLHRDMTPAVDVPEAGWALAPWAHGRGLATEAVRAVLAWGDAHLAAPATACIIDPGNVASIRVATKCGYVEQTRTTYKGDPTIVFHRARAGA